MPQAHARPAMGGRSLWLTAATVVLAGLAIVPWFTSFGPVTGERGGIFAAIVATAVPGILLLRASRNAERYDRLWQALVFLGGSMLLASGGNVLRLLDAFGVPLPAIPGVGPVSDIGIWALGLFALLRLPLMPAAGGTRWRVATDVVIAGLGMALILFVVWTLPGLTQAPQSLRLRIMMYNVMEAGNLVVLNMILVRGPLRPVRRAVWWLAATVVLETAYLVGFQYGIGRNAPDDRMTNCLFFVDYLAYLYAADAFLSDTKPGLEAPLRPIQLWSVNPLPIVAVLGVGGLLVASAIHGYQPALVPLALGIVVMTVLLLGRVIGTTFEGLAILQHKAEEDRRQRAERMELVGRLSGRIARIVQTLVAGVRFHAELLRADAARSPQMRGSLEAIGTSTQKASALAERLLLASGHRRGDLRPSRLGDSVRMQQESVNLLVGDKRIMIWDIAGGSGDALVDPADLETIMRELVANAGEATFHGGRITIRIREETLAPQSPGISPCPAPGRYSVIEVSDTGRGIAEDDLPHVLEPFFTKKSTGADRGLGLSVVHGIAARYGGGLRIETAPGTGSRVQVYLPAAEPQPA